MKFNTIKNDEDFDLLRNVRDFINFFTSKVIKRNLITLIIFEIRSKNLSIQRKNHLTQLKSFMINCHFNFKNKLINNLIA